MQKINNVLTIFLIITIGILGWSTYRLNEQVKSLQAGSISTADTAYAHAGTLDSLAQVVRQNQSWISRNQEDVEMAKWAIWLNPDVFFLKADRAIANLRSGEQPRGSLSDYLEVSLWHAHQVGATKGELIKRFRALDEIRDSGVAPGYFQSWRSDDYFDRKIASIEAGEW